MTLAEKRARRLDSSRRWCAANREKIAKRKAAHYAANREKIAKRISAYRAANLEKTRKYRLHQRLGLADMYVRQRLSTRTALSHRDIPQGLVEAKRLQLQIKRFIQENTR